MAEPAAGMQDPWQRAFRYTGGRTGVLLALLALLVLAGIFGFMSRQSYEHVLNRAVQQAHGAARSAQLEVNALLREKVMALEALAATVSPVDGATRRAGSHKQLQFQRVVEQIGDGEVVLLDRDGAFRYRDNLAEAVAAQLQGALFAAHAAQSSLAPVLTPVADQRLMLVLSRRIETASGGFAGVVALVLPPTLFERPFRTMELGQQGALALLLEDGRLVARHPPLVDGGNGPARLPQGSGPAGHAAIAVPPLDGVARVYAQQRLVEWGVVVQSGISHAEAVARWRSEFLVNLAIGVTGLGGTLFALGGLTVQNRRLRTAQRELRESEENFRRMTGALPGIVFQLQRDARGDYRLLFVSSQVEAAYGIDAAALMADPIGVFGAISENAGQMLGSVERSAAYLTPWSYQWALRRGSEKRYVRAEATPRACGGGAVQWDGIVVDVTELVEARNTLAAERQLFTGGPVVVVRRGGEPGWPIDYVSPNVEAVWGYRPNSLLDGNHHFIELVHGEDRGALQQQLAALAAAGDSSCETEYRLLRQDGTVRWVHDYTVVRRGGGAACRYHGYLLDITERKAMERAISAERDFARTIIDSLPGVFYILDQQGRFRQYNRQLLDVLGYSGDELSSLTAAEVIVARDRAALAAALGEVFERGASHMSSCLLTRDGRELPYYFTGRRFEDESGLLLIGMGVALHHPPRLAALNGGGEAQ